MQQCRDCGQANPDGFRLCGMCGSPLGTEEPERRKVATLLFCDMSGSTALGERVDAESVRDLMFRYFHEMRSAIERHGGTVEKFIGDAVMAVFGVPRAHEDDALRAVRAARDMQERIGSLNEELARRFGARVALRIGVNSGEVVTGDSSSHQALVTGDAVNVAARLEQAAAPGEVLLGEETYRLVQHAVTATVLEPLGAKGKSEPLKAYRLVKVLEDAPVRPLRRDRQLVGREGELRTLVDAFERALSSRRCIPVTVVGEPGVGKSRLAVELVAIVGRRATVLSGSSPSYGEGVTFWALGELVRQAAAIRDEDTQEQARDRILTLVKDADDAALIVDRVAQAIGLGGGSSSADQIGAAVRRFFEALARRKPLVVLIDDLQWAEPTFLDVLTELIDRVDDAPILLLCLARSGLLETSWPHEPTIHLEPLTHSETEALMELVLAGEEFEPVLAARVRAAAAGNPLFVEELLAMLRESPGEAVAMPPSLSALMAARLEQLGPSERAALERASIEGEVFHRGAVVELSPADAADQVSRALEILVDKDFVLPSEASFADEAAFRFRHLLVRDAAYNAAPKKLRADLHERFATWLERRALARVAEQEEILGYHLEQAYRFRAELGPVDATGRELARRGARRLASAGQRALARGDLPAARSLFARTSALLPPGDAIRLTLLPDRGAALGYQLESEYRKRLAIGRDDGETRALGRAASERLVSAGRRAVERGDAIAAVNLLAKAISLLGPAAQATAVSDADPASTRP